MSPEKKIPKRIAVFASGNGTNLQALLDFSEKKGFNGDIVLVFSNNPDAFALHRAKMHGIKTETFMPGDFSDRVKYDSAILDMLEREKIDVLVLAGYMLLLGKKIIKKYRRRILNIHPALLPSFKGTHGIRDAFDYGVRVTGVTVHFVEEDLDSGPIVMQAPVPVSQQDTLEIVEKKIHQLEHILYPQAVKYLCDDALILKGRKVFILKKGEKCRSG